MKLSSYVPKYSTLEKLIPFIDKMQVLFLNNCFLATIESHSQYETDISKKRLEEKNIRKKLIDLIINLYEETGEIISFKHVEFAIKHKLIVEAEAKDVLENEKGRWECYKITKKGEMFLSKDEDILAEIDKEEALILILDDIAKYNGSDDIYTETFLSFKELDLSLDFKESRIENLVNRRLMTRRCTRSFDPECTYKASKKGLRYLENFQFMKSSLNPEEKQILLNSDIETLKMKKYLHKMDPYKFEELVSILVKKMGYSNIKITTKGNDNGIDIIATLDAGTAKIKEIIQVKRWKSNIQRPTLDQIRGALTTSNAIRGCIITTSDFSQGCYDSIKSNHSINLINGTKLIALLIRHKIGFEEKTITTYNFTPETIFI